MAFSWIELDGVLNMRDLAGTRLAGGDRIAPHRLVRSDNLNFLTDHDVAVLIEQIGVVDVVDLRSCYECQRIGVSPLEDDPRVRVHHGSLYPETDPSSDVPPWKASVDAIGSANRNDELAQHYLNYLRWSPEVVVGYLRVIASSPGATVVHCAAGKDRTGTIIGLLLCALGADEQDIIDDYAASGQRLSQIVARLGEATSAGAATHGAYDTPDQSTPPEVMARFLELLGGQQGALDLLGSHGWTAADHEQLRRTLTSPHTTVGSCDGASAHHPGDGGRVPVAASVPTTGQQPPAESTTQDHEL